jgi:N-acetylglutamate synthase-like GNAT family acetyltransferase
MSNILTDNQTYKIYAYLCGGFYIKNISKYNNFTFLRIYKFNIFKKDTYIGMIDYEKINDNILIHNICIEDKYQNNGIGSFLLKKVELDAQLDNINIITLYIHENKRNYMFYKKRGFECNYKDNKLIRWNKNYNYIQMIKHLST